MDIYTNIAAVLVIFLLSQCYIAAQVAFNGTGIISVNDGETLIFECSARAYHLIELLEIGQILTFEEKKTYSVLPDNITMYYEPTNCSFIDDDSQCSKIYVLTVTADMDRKAYQCRSLRRNEHNAPIFYSEGGYIQVNDIINPTTVMTDTAQSPADKSSVHHNTEVLCPSPPTVTRPHQSSLPDPSIITPTSYNNSDGGINPLSLQWRVLMTVVALIYILL